MIEEEQFLAEIVLKDLRGYLQDHLTVDQDFISGLFAAGLLGYSDADRLGSSVTRGGNEALYGLLHYMESFYDEEMLERFCAFLEKKAKSARPTLGIIAKKIRQEMNKHKPAPLHQFNPHQQGGVPRPTASGPPSSSPATQGEPTPTVSTMDERSQKIEEIVDMYRSESTKVSLPEIPELEDDFDDIMGSLNAELSSADPKVIAKLVGVLRGKYRRYIHGVKPGKVPSIPNTASGLCEFIAEKSTSYEILLVHHAVDVLNCEDLRRTMQNYESKLADHLRLTLELYKKRKVTLPIRKHHTHLAIVLSKEQVLLSLVLHIKDYLMKYLKLEEAMFEGFGEGCTILFFSILRIDVDHLASKVLSHSAELKSFDMTHLVVFDYFACDLERATIEHLKKLHRPSVERKVESSMQLTLMVDSHPVTEEGQMYIGRALAEVADEISHIVDRHARIMEIKMSVIDRWNIYIGVLPLLLPRWSRIAFKVFIVGITMRLLEWKHAWSTYVQMRLRKLPFSHILFQQWL